MGHADPFAFDDNYRDVFRAGDFRYQHFQRLAEVFGAGDGDCVILLEGRNVLSRQSITAIRQIHSQVADLPDVESIVSLHSARKARRKEPANRGDRCLWRKGVAFRRD